VFVNDQPDDRTLKILVSRGTRLLALRCAGFNNVDLKAAAELGITVVRVPAYSPYAVAEYSNRRASEDILELVHRVISSSYACPV